VLWVVSQLSAWQVDPLQNSILQSSSNLGIFMKAFKIDLLRFITMLALSFAMLLLLPACMLMACCVSQGSLSNPRGRRCGPASIPVNSLESRRSTPQQAKPQGKHRSLYFAP
jgi:hypothetical protein